MRLFACVTVLAACGGDGGDPRETALAGIYTLTSWTRAEGMCSSEGPSVLATETDKLIVVRPNSFFGQSFIELVPCPTLEECRASAADDTVQFSQFGSVQEGNDDDGWIGGRIIAGGSGQTCSGTVTETHLGASGPMMIRIGAQHTRTGDFAPDAEGFCTTDDAEAAAALQPCDGLDVLYGTFTEPL